MLPPYQTPLLSDDDVALFDALVPFDHWVRRAEQLVDFAALRRVAESFYSAHEGAPGVEPVLLIKLILLQFHDNLSDRQLWQRVQTDLAYRWFLGLGRQDHLPDVTTLNKFRARLGSEGFKSLFHGLLGQCRTQGLVRDRLRIKDATHVVADIAVPAGLTLVAQARDRLLRCAQPFAAGQVAGEKVQIETIRSSTKTQADDARLAARIEHLRDILAWSDDLPVPQDSELNPRWQSLEKAREVARKVLAGHDRPTDPGKLRSVADPDARRGKHGVFYDGYLLDVTIDADSELFTALNALPADGNESADTLDLVDQETSAQGNQIENISIDGAGFDGPMLRQLEDPQGRNIKAFVPPRQKSSHKFDPDDFQLSDDGEHLICPQGNQSQYRQRDNSREATIYRFDVADCRICPLRAECGGKSMKFGRSVNLSDYHDEHRRVRQRALTPEYVSVKHEHPTVERKLGHVVNRHGGRRARYRGLDRMKCQAFMIGLTANLKRMIALVTDLPLIGREFKAA